VIEAAEQEARVVDDYESQNISFIYYPRLEKLRIHVESHIAEPLCLERAANIAGLEKTYFSKFFHDKTGICFRDWLNQVRVSRAFELLKQSDLSITEVAYEVGFQDLRTFERAVKKHLGCTPMAMKKQLKCKT
jgi:AraC-like DNA-binding protein